MGDDSDSWFPDLLCAIVGLVLGVIASNTAMHSVEISETVSVFMALPCGVVLVGMHFRRSCLGGLLQIVAAIAITIVVVAGK
jgi:hypothetical protein